MADLSIQSFEFPSNRLRVVMRNGEPWFVAADVCAALDLTNTTRALERLDADEQALSSIQGFSRGNDAVNLINESGLYSLVLGSRKPEAKKFKKWVTGEVLPAIRKTGRYEAPIAVAAAPAAPALPDTRLVIALEAAVAEIGKLKDLLIGGQSQHIKALNKLNTLQRRFEAREARNMIIDMARLGHSREAIAAATGRKFNHIRQVIFQAKRAGVLTRDASATQATSFRQGGFDFNQGGSVQEFNHA